MRHNQQGSNMVAPNEGYQHARPHVHPRGGDSSLQIWLRLRGWLAGKSTKRNGSFNGKISYKWLYICLNNGCTISPTFLLSSGERRERFGAMGIHVLHEMGSQGT